jgi:hypothetical protein
MYERRKEERADIQVPVWMEAPSQLLPCTLQNISLHGAEVVVSPDMPLPKKFALRLTQDGKIRRGCSVVWRRGDRVGVTFFRLAETNTQRNSVLV